MEHHGLFHTVWLVPTEGYRWVDADGERWLTGRVPVEQNEDGRPVDGVLRVAALHRRYAATHPTPERFLRFANRFGALNEPDHAHRQPDGVVVLREPFSLWLGEWIKLNVLIGLWDLVRVRNAKLLGQLVHWIDSDTVWLAAGVRHDRHQLEPDVGLELWRQATALAQETAQPILAVVAEESRAGGVLVRRVEGNLGYRFDAFGARLPAEIVRWCTFDDAVGPARHYIVACINAMLFRRTSVCAMPLDGHCDILIVPESLLAALYVHLLHEVAGRTRPPVRCANPGCGRYFIPVHGRQRHCDDRCRWSAKYYREKHRSRCDDPTRLGRSRSEVSDV